jgi:hypothetical protein
VRGSSSCGASTRPISDPSTCCVATVTDAPSRWRSSGSGSRYQERLDRDGTLAPTIGMFVATKIKPQARVYAESRGVLCVEVDLETLRAGAPPDLRLF